MEEKDFMQEDQGTQTDEMGVMQQEEPENTGKSCLLKKR